ncbi:MAG: hypothetical protein GY740_25185 [Gammaproteobacteria bacterium]|nr:hypothetical protein [Gammaproteobacteria bacterium]
MININQALNRLEFRFTEKDSKGNSKLREVIKPNLKDIEAINAISNFRDTQMSINLTENEPLAKLFIAYFIVLCESRSYSSKRALEVIDEILDKSTYEWCQILTKKIPQLKLNNVGNHIYPITFKNQFNRTQLDKREKRIKEEYPDELIQAILTEVNEDDVIKWVEDIITGITNK